MNPTLGKRKVKVKRAMKRRGVTYDDVARLAGVSWFMVWAVLNGRKVSARVMGAVEKLIALRARLEG